MYKEVVVTTSPTSLVTERYIYEQNQQYSERYDSNFLSYKRMPSLEELNEDIEFVKGHQENYPSSYVHLSFPENEILPENICSRLEELSFEISTDAIMVADEEKVHFSKNCSVDVTLERLDENRFDDYARYLIHTVKEYGELYQQQIQEYAREQLQTSTILLAMHQGEIVGEMTLHLTERFLEIDQFIIEESYRGKGIGSLLQKAAMTMKNEQQRIILIAEKEEVAYEMYLRQGYREVAFYQEAYWVE